MGTPKIATAIVLKSVKLLRVGVFNSFVNSLIASANGTKAPVRPGLLGPFRRWIYPRTLRSRRVKKATATITRRRVSRATM